MKRPRIKLTEAIIERLKPPASGYAWHRDATVGQGFGLRHYATGSKVWGLTRIWEAGKHPSFKSIGEHPETSLADARKRAGAILSGDSDAVQARTRAIADSGDSTFGSLADAFLQHSRTKRGRTLRAKTAGEYARALRVYAKELHDKAVRDIRRGDAAGIIRTVAAERGATSGRACRAALSRFFSWCIANDFVEANPTTGTESYTIEKRDRTLNDQELAAIWEATADDTDFSLIVRLCLWTGARRSEIGSMRWSELQEGSWTLPSSRAKNHRALTLPLPQQALGALQRHPRWLGRDHLFGRGSNGFQGWSKAKERLDAKLGFARPWDLHDLRRSCQTRWIGLGYSRELVNVVLNHAMGPIDETYNRHGYLQEKAKLLQAWADELERICAKPVKVVAIA